MPIESAQTARLAAEVLAAGDAVRPIAPLTDTNSGFDLDDAYRVSAEIVRLREKRGERPVGWKIGFTNETIWDEYGVHAPIWGPMYDSTVAEADPAGATCAIGKLSQPRIEPEIALRIAVAPSPDMDERALLGCVEAVAHGFEIVQSIYPGWRFKAPDTVAAFGLHGCYRHGPFVAVDAADREQWLTGLARFAITLLRDDSEVDRGRAENVLGGGPLTALRHFVRGLAANGSGPRLRPGDIVTTGTVTRAFPVAPGESWSTRIEGLPLQGMTLTFA